MDWTQITYRAPKANQQFLQFKLTSRRSFWQPWTSQSGVPSAKQWWKTTMQNASKSAISFRAAEWFMAQQCWLKKKNQDWGRLRLVELFSLVELFPLRMMGTDRLRSNLAFKNDLPQDLSSGHCHLLASLSQGKWSDPWEDKGREQWPKSLLLHMIDFPWHWRKPCVVFRSKETRLDEFFPPVIIQHSG